MDIKKIINYVIKKGFAYLFPQFATIMEIASIAMYIYEYIINSKTKAKKC